jgi:hypothetical protein
VCSFEYTAQDFAGDVVGPEAPDIATLGDHAVDSFTRIRLEMPAARVSSSLGSTRRVEARWCRRATDAIGTRHEPEQYAACRACVILLA